MRLFAAIDPPDPLRDRLERLQEGLPERGRVAWENLHLTLGFFGDVDAHRAEDLDAALARIRFAPFEVSLSGVDVFGGGRPRLVYAAARGGDPLDHLARAVTEAARGVGIAMEARRYVPHVTLARMKGRPADERFMRWLAGAAGFAAPAFGVDRFTLYRSHLGGEGAHYEPLRAYAAALMT